MIRRITFIMSHILFLLASVSFGGEYTANLNMYKPTVGELGWGDLVNINNWANLDTRLKGWHSGGMGTAFFASRYASLNAAHEAAAAVTGGVVILDNATSLVSSATLTTSVPVIWQGGTITHTAGSKIHFDSTLEGGLKQVFVDFSAGDVSGLKEVWAEWFGAIGDAITDDGPKITLAFSALDTNGIMHCSPAVVYAATNIIIPHKQFEIRGHGAEFKKITGGDNSYLIAHYNWVNNLNYAGLPIKIRNLKMNGNSITTIANYVHQSWDSRIDDCEFYGSLGHGMRQAGRTQDETALSSTLVNNKISKCTFRNNGLNGFQNYDPARNKATDTWFQNNTVYSNGSNGLFIQAGAGWIITGNHFYSDTIDVYIDDGGLGTIFTNNYLESSSAIYINWFTAPQIVLSNNQINGYISFSSNVTYTEEIVVSQGNRFGQYGQYQIGNRASIRLVSQGDRYAANHPVVWGSPGYGRIAELRSFTSGSVFQQGNYGTRKFSFHKTGIASATTTSLVKFTLPNSTTVAVNIRFGNNLNSGYSGYSELWRSSGRRWNDTTEAVAVPTAIYQENIGSVNAGYLALGAATVTAAIAEHEITISINATISGTGYTDQTINCDYELELISQLGDRIIVTPL